MIFILLFCFSEEITQMEKAKFGEYCQVSFHEHRVLTSPLILLPAETSHHIWLWPRLSTETVRNLLLPAKTVVLGK